MSARELPSYACGRDVPPVNWGRQIYFSMVAAIALLALYPAYNHWRIERYESLRQQISSFGGDAPRLRRSKTAEQVYWAALGGNMADVALRHVHFPQSATLPAEVLRRLRGCAEIQQLHLEGQELDPAMCRDVFAMRRLEKLRLCYCQLSDDELRGLEHLHRLTTLDLRGTTVTDASLNRLARLHGLAELNLQYTNITSAGAARLARELPETQVRHRSWPSERYRRRCQRLFVAGALIEISEDPARGDCLRLVRERWRGTPEDMAEIAHLNIELLQLESLDLEPEFLASLAALPNLKSLAIGSCRLRDIDFTPLSRSLSLRNIALKDVVVGSPVIEELAQLPQLDSLALVRTRLGPGSLASLSRLTLHKLAIVGTWIREESLFSLAQVKSLRHLELMRVSLPERHLDRLAEVSQLESLALNQIATGDNCVSYLSRLAHLRRLDIDNTLLTPAGAKRLEEALPGCEVNTNTSPRPEFDLVQFFSSSRGA